MTQQRRRLDYLSFACIGLALLFVMCGMLSAQMSQDTINALADERYRQLTKQFQELQNTGDWIKAALCANFGAHIFQIWSGTKRRRE